MKWSLSEDAEFLLLVPKTAILDRVFAKLELKPDDHSTQIEEHVPEIAEPSGEISKEFDEAPHHLPGKENQESSLNLDPKRIEKSLEILRNCTRDHCYVGENVTAYLIVTPTLSASEKENNRQEIVDEDGFPSKLPPWFQYFRNLYCHLEIPITQAETVSVIRACSKTMESLDSETLNTLSLGVDMLDSLKLLLSTCCVVYCFEFQIPNEISSTNTINKGDTSPVQIDILCMRPADSSNFGYESVAELVRNRDEVSRVSQYEYRYKIAGCDFPFYDPMLMSLHRKDPPLRHLEGLCSNPNTLMPRETLLNDPNCTIRMSHRLLVTKMFRVESKSYFIANRCMISVSVENVTASETIDIHDIALVDGLESFFTAELLGGIRYPLLLQPSEQHNFVFCITRRIPYTESSRIRIHDAVFRSRIEIRWCSGVFYRIQRCFHFADWNWAGKLDVPLAINLVGEGLNTYPVAKAFTLILEIWNKGDDEFDLDVIIPTTPDQIAANNEKNVSTCMPLNISIYAGVLKPKSTIKTPLRFIALQNGSHQVTNKLFLKDRSSSKLYDMSSQCLLEVNIDH